MTSDNKCQHKTLKRLVSGSLAWYVCANPDCDAPKVKGTPQKFKAVPWDGKIQVVDGGGQAALSSAGTSQPNIQSLLDQLGKIECGSDSSAWERITSTLARCGCGAVVALVQSKRKRPVWSAPSERAGEGWRDDDETATSLQDETGGGDGR